MPELHALKQRQQVARLRTDLLRRELATETAADREAEARRAYIALRQAQLASQEPPKAPE